MTNWYPSMLNFDLCSGSLSGSMNIQWNAGLEDFAARQMMFNIPAFSFNGFMPYNNPISFDPGNIFMYTLGQMDWQNRTQGGSGLFDANGQFQLPFNNQFGGNMFNVNPSLGQTPSNSSKEPETAEEIGYKRKFNTLLSLAKQLVNANGETKLSQNDKDILNAAIRANTKGTNEDKYKALKTEFDKIDKDTVKSILVNSELIATNSDKANRDKSFKSELATAGYELENETDDLLSELKIALGKASEGVDMDSVTAIGKIQSKQGDIVLDIISSWNNENKTNRLPKAIMSAYNKISDANEKKTYRSEVIEPLGTGLIDKAKSLKSVGDSASQRRLADAIKAVEDGLSAKNLPSDLATKLDKLYLLTRQAAIVQLRKEVLDHYGDVAPEIFNNELFAKETVDDLKAEGFTEKELKDNEIKAGEKAKAAQGEAEVKASETPSAEETEAKEEAEKTSEAEETETETTTNNAKAEVNGERVWELLTEWHTNNEEAKEINNCLKTVDKSNVMSFLKGVYGSKTSKGCEGLIEKIDDDAHNKENGIRIISMDTKRALIKAVIDCAGEALGDNDTDLIKLQQYYDKFTTGDCKSEEDFSKAYKTVLGITTLSYSEVIDECIFNLFKKISA